MATNIKLILALLLVHMLTSYSTCKTNCAGVDFSFAITNRVYPDKDSISVGDTIWVEIDSPTKLLDQRSNTEVDYSGTTNFGTAINLLEIKKGSVEQPSGVDAANSFKTHLVIGDSIKPLLATKSRAFAFKEMNSRFRFKVGLIPQAKGDFMISPGNADNVYRGSDKCSKAGFNITIAGTDQHLYLYQQSRPGYEMSQYEKTHVYCVRVK